MSKKIVVKIEGKPYGEAGPLVGPNCTVYGRIRNTETDTWESDWIALPVSALDFDIEASSFAQARITVTVNSLKNIELALGEINVKKTFVDPEREPWPTDDRTTTPVRPLTTHEEKAHE